DGFDGARDARVIRRQEADLRNEQQRCVELGSVVVLDEGVARGIVAVAQDVRMDFPAHRRPTLLRALEFESLARFDAAVERDPGHDTRVGERARRAAYLPDALVGLVPHLLEVPEQRALQAP